MSGVAFESDRRALHRADPTTNDRTTGETASLVAKLGGWFFVWIGLGACWDYPGQRIDEIKAELWPEPGVPASIPATEEGDFPQSRLDYGSLAAAERASSSRISTASALYTVLSREEPISRDMLDALHLELAMDHPILHLANRYVHGFRSLERLQEVLQGRGSEIRKNLPLI